MPGRQQSNHRASDSVTSPLEQPMREMGIHRRLRRSSCGPKPRRGALSRRTGPKASSPPRARLSHHAVRPHSCPDLDVVLRSLKPLELEPGPSRLPLSLMQSARPRGGQGNSGKRVDFSWCFRWRTAHLCACSVPACWMKTNVPFLLPTMMAGLPVPVMSPATTWVPTPESSSIWWATNSALPSLRTSSNQ